LATEFTSHVVSAASALHFSVIAALIWDAEK
jgi:hypothetical protein